MDDAESQNSNSEETRLTMSVIVTPPCALILAARENALPSSFLLITPHVFVDAPFEEPVKNLDTADECANVQRVPPVR